MGFWVEDSVAGTLASGKTAGLSIGSHVDDCTFDWLTGPGDSLLTLARLGCCVSPWYACLHSPILESITPPSSLCENKWNPGQRVGDREREREREIRARERTSKMKRERDVWNEGMSGMRPD